MTWLASIISGIGSAVARLVIWFVQRRDAMSLGANQERREAEERRRAEFALLENKAKLAEHLRRRGVGRMDNHAEK